MNTVLSCQNFLSIKQVILLVFFALACLTCTIVQGQDIDDNLGSQLDDLQITPEQLPLCFGMRDITEPRALAICDALRLDQNVRARELSEDWVRVEPGNPAAQFAFAEVLYSVEANLPRALFHLKEAEELTNYRSMGRALASGNIQWHYLTLSQLSFIYQLMGDQVNALAYLDKINSIYAQDIESFRGWPLLKLKEYDAARASANLVIQNSDNPRDRARAWNTLCAVELASLQPKETITACDNAVLEGDTMTENQGQGGTVYLTNASEVSLSLLEFGQAENFLDRATEFINPESVADPWIYKLYITMNQARFDAAYQAFNRMLLWRESQVPAVTIMNRAEHLMAAASFLLLAGYSEAAAELTTTALNEPDRNGTYSADDAQKDSVAALLNMLANEAHYQKRLEEISILGFGERTYASIAAHKYRLAAWQSARKAASLFADLDILLNRLRPYAPLDVHIPEWIEPDLVRIMGTGVMLNTLEQARDKGAFLLNEGYYFSYLTEIEYLDGNTEAVIASGQIAMENLPEQEALLKGRVLARLAEANWQAGRFQQALLDYQSALLLDPSLFRRLNLSLPITIVSDGSPASDQAARLLKRSPRFRQNAQGFIIRIAGESEFNACLLTTGDETISCYTASLERPSDELTAPQQLVLGLHEELFSQGFEISDAEIGLLQGSSVIMSNRNNPNIQLNRENLLQ